MQGTVPYLIQTNTPLETRMKGELKEEKSTNLIRL
jgi:hypothetical protein